MRSLPGIRFDLFGRMVAARLLLKGFRRDYLSMLLNPISSTRYFEMDFARRCLRGVRGALLDVSSPRLLPLLMAQAGRFQVTMINPDPQDLDESMRLCNLISRRRKVAFDKDVDARRLPYKDSSFDALTCVSVIEHIEGNGDSQALLEFARVVRPGGKIILTFPVSGKYYEEFRSGSEYQTGQEPDEKGRFFFQRFYDETAIDSRITNTRQIKVISKEYFVEVKPGWFDAYVQKWMRQGLKITIWDPWLMAKYFRGPQALHPRDRVGVCMLCLEVEPN